MFVRIGNDVVLNVWAVVNNFIQGFAWGLGITMAVVLFYLYINLVTKHEAKKKEKSK